MRVLAVLLLLAAAVPASADTLVAVRTIRAGEVIGAADVRPGAQSVPGALADALDAVGREARQILYAGQPVRAADLADPAVVERNGLVVLIYDRHGVFIRTEGRALGRGAVGARIRVMNLASRSTVTATVAAPGRVTVP